MWSPARRRHNTHNRGLTDGPIVCCRRIARLWPSYCPPRIPLGLGCGAHIVGVGAVSADVLFHVVFPGERLVANGAMDVLLACVLLAVARSVAGSRECS